jgi:ArsR family transcriptional regulator
MGWCYNDAVALPLPERVRGVCCPPAIPLLPRRADRTVDTLRALADPTRLQMVAILQRAEAPVCICDLTDAFHLSQPTISHHMAKLKEAGLVEASKRGIWTYYRLRTALDPKTQRLLEAVL